MGGIGRIDVGIVVRIVVSIGNFIVVIHVGKRERRHALIRFKRGKFRRHVVAVQPERARGHRAERGVRVIETGIEHRDHRTRAVVGRLFRIIDARRINVCVVRYGDGGNGVRFGNVHARYAADLFDRGNVFQFQSERKPAHEFGIGVFLFVRNALSIECGKHFALRVSKFALARSAFLRIQICGKRGIFIGAVKRFHQTLTAQIDDEPVFLIFIDGIRRNNVLIEVFLSERARIVFTRYVGQTRRRGSRRRARRKVLFTRRGKRDARNQTGRHGDRTTPQYIFPNKLLHSRSLSTNYVQISKDHENTQYNYNIKDCLNQLFRQGNQHFYNQL